MSLQFNWLGPWLGFLLLCIHSELDQDGERICGSKYSFWNPWNYTESKLSKQTVLLTLGEGGGSRFQPEEPSSHLLFALSPAVGLFPCSCRPLPTGTGSPHVTPSIGSWKR